MTYNQFLKLSVALMNYINTYPISFKRDTNFLINYGFAENEEQANYIRRLVKEHRRGNCTTERLCIALIYMHYRSENIVLENAMGTRAHLSHIIKEFEERYEKKIFKVRDKIRAIERFIYDGL